MKASFVLICVFIYTIESTTLRFGNERFRLRRNQASQGLHGPITEDFNKFLVLLVFQVLEFSKASVSEMATGVTISQGPISMIMHLSVGKRSLRTGL